MADGSLPAWRSYQESYNASARKINCDAFIESNKKKLTICISVFCNNNVFIFQEQIQIDPHPFFRPLPLGHRKAY